MIGRFHDIKIVTLTAAMALGTVLQADAARAADTETAFVAGGCFWCVESDFEKVKGVKEVISGFDGGKAPDPTYEQVARENTDYKESAKIIYDPDQVSYRQLIDLFFHSIDPTDAGGQFCDRGPSYTTAVFVDGPEQRKAAEAAKQAAQKELGQKIVTPIEKTTTFYPADDYHQDYYKSDDIILFTRYGPTKKKIAYHRYRQACGRDQRVRELWGDDAPFLPQDNQNS